MRSLVVTICAGLAIAGCRSTLAPNPQEWRRIQPGTAEATVDLDACIEEVVAGSQPMQTGFRPDGMYLLTNDGRRQEHLNVCMRNKGWTRSPS